MFANHQIIGLDPLSTQSHLTTCYASHHYAGRVISAEGIGLDLHATSKWVGSLVTVGGI